MRPRDRRTLLATWGWDWPEYLEQADAPDRPDPPGTVVLDMEAEDWLEEPGKGWR